MLSKTEFRTFFKNALDSLSASELRQQSRQVCEGVIRLIPVNANRVVAFFPTEKEVDIRPLLIQWLGQGVAIFLPYFDHKNSAYRFAQIYDLDRIEPGYLGMMEPLSKEASFTVGEMKEIAQMWVVPGLGFNKLGQRMGRGKGFYDHFLSGSKGLKMGLCFNVQLTTHIFPKEPHDIDMDMVVSPDQTYVIRTTRNLNNF